MSLESAAKHREMSRDVSALVKKHGVDVLDLFRTEIQKNLLSAFERTYGVKKGTSRGVLRLIGKDSEIEPPKCDHPQVYNKGGKAHLFVYQPYGFPDPAEMNAFCDKYGLEWSIGPCSWHFLGQTYLVVIRRKAESVKKK